MATRPPRTGAVWLRRIHRTTGIAAAAFVLVLAISGLLLNHANALGLDRRYLSAGMLQALYGVSERPPAISFATAAGWVTGMGDTIYLDARPVAEHPSALVGAVQVDDSLAVALEDALLLLTTAGETIEKLAAGQGIPAGLRGAGVAAQGGLALRTGERALRLDRDTLEQVPVSRERVRWAAPASPPEPLMQRIVARYDGSRLSYERALLDLHSGRLLGAAGRLLFDAAGALLVVLAATGAWMWLRDRAPPGNPPRGTANGERGERR